MKQLEREYEPTAAAWIKKTKTGEDYLSVKLKDGSFIKLFKNKYKNADNHPDYKEAKPKPNVAGSEPILKEDEFPF